MYFQCLQRVEFRDTDAAGIAHFSVFANWMERAEHQMLRGFGWSVVQIVNDKTVSWPRVNVSCDFRQPLKFEDLFGVELSVLKLGRSSATYRFSFLSANDWKQLGQESQQSKLMDAGQVTRQSWFQSLQPAAVGTITAVCCEVVHGQRPVSIEIPADLRTHLETLQIVE